MSDDEEKMELNELEVTQVVDLMKHTIGLTSKYEKKLQFVPWRNYFDGQNDLLDKMANMGYMYRDTSFLSGDVCYSVSVRGYQWLQGHVSVNILLPVSQIRRNL